MLFIVILILILIITLSLANFMYKENMVNIAPLNKEIKWATDPTCHYKMTQIYLDILNEYSINKTNNNDWMIYFPCTYNDNKNEIKKIIPSSNDQRIFIITNTNELASKSDLWKNLVKKYGRDQAKVMSPNSYILYDDSDKILFNKEYDKNKIYIMKKNIQRQEGLKLTNNKDEILGGYNNGYVIVQELLQNPYLVRDRKINMRFYILFVCQHNELSAYIHKEGFMYYTKMPFIPNSPEFGSNITTGYIERWVYHVNPLSHTDFREYLDNTNRVLLSEESKLVNSGKKISEEVFNKIYILLTAIVNAVTYSVCKGSHIKNNITFQLFGVDVALGNDLNPQVMEVNIGPNLATHDKRDSDIKHMIVRDILKVLKIIPDIDNGFINIV